MPDPLTDARQGTRRRALTSVLTLAGGLIALVACADRIIAPDAPTADASAAPVLSLAVSDVVDRVAPSLHAGIHAVQLTSRLAELRRQMESGRYSDAELSLVLARNALYAARAADDGAMDADLTVIDLALDDASQMLSAASAESRKRPRR